MRNFQLPGRSPAYAANGMAATSSPLATLAALDTLRAGGNAADAAVAASAVLCITEPHMTGIGGDCFVLVGEPTGKVLGLNGSGRASHRADATWLKASGLTEIPVRSIHAITVPGAIDAWDQLLKRCGTMTLGDCLAPAIALAEKGVPTTPRVAHDWPEDVPDLTRDDGGRQHYLVNGLAPQCGHIMRYQALAQTLKLIARDGRDAFYEGALARDIVATIAPMGSLLGLEDFAAHRSDWVEPISVDFAGCEILEIPPNGQGLTALIALNILGNFGLRSLDPASPQRMHLDIEALKLAWFFRNKHIADPAYADVPVAELLSPAFARKLAGLIDPRKCLDIATALPRSDTVYLTVIDKNRLAVSFINSVYDGFGSAVVTPATGIALQNRGACFVTKPGHPNCIGPSKRPLHTIIPAMVRHRGLVDMSYGVMGGDYQPMGHMVVAANRYVYAMDPQECLDFPRYFPKAGEVRVEAGVAPSAAADLAAIGHKVVPSAGPLGGGQAIAIDRVSGLLIGGSDPRKDGMALGY
jgi:gamma-glutamyltranspeptidase/glutathione hydrolase